MRLRAALAAGIVFALLVVIAQMTGPVRTHGGDVAVTAFLYFAARAVLARKPLPTAAGVFALATLVEGSQALRLDERLGVEGTAFGRLVLGSTFDPRDIAAYALGVLLAVLVERFLLRPDGQLDGPAA